MKSTHNPLLLHTLAFVATVATTVFLTIGDAHAADAVFSSSAFGAGDNDANVGLLSTKTYFNAVNIEGGALTINGVSFASSAGGNPTGTGYTISGVPLTVGSGATNNVTGQLGSLVDNFIYNGNPGVFTLTGLTAGQTYALTYYNRVWGGPRTQNITTTSGATTSFDQDFNATGDLNLLRYTFTASGTSETLNFAQAGASMHFYGFSTEQVFNNTWTSGADWTAATWSVGVPNAVGANADFTAQGAPTAINLDAPQTVGHLRFAGANAWTVSGPNTLTLEADVAGVSVLGATSGTHTISSAVTLNSDVLKTGAGTVVLSGALTDNGNNVTLGAGTLQIANAAAQSMSGNFTGGGNLAKGGAGTLTLTGNITYTGATTINAGTLEFAPTGAVTFGNAIGGAGSFAKGGAETLTLTGTNTYTGATVVNAGTLKLQAGSTPLLTDNFSATGNPNTSDLNFNLANRQTGSAATQNWTPLGNTQVGNPTVVQQPPGTNGDYLLLANGAEAKLAGLPLSTGNVPGPLKINFDMFKGTTGDPTAWTSFRLSPSGSGFPIAGSGELGFLYRNNTGIQIFNNGGLLQDFGSTAGGDSFGFYLADSAGTGSPFAGNGTRVIVTQGGSIIGSYALNTSMASSLIAFGSISNTIGGVDNLVVNNFKTNVLDPATAVSLPASGATLELDGVIQTVASLSGVSGSAVNLGPFSRLTVSGAASTSFDGVIAGTFGSLTKAGAGTLTLTGTNTYTGITTVNGGTLIVTGSLANNGPANILMATPDSTIAGNPIITRRIANAAIYALGSTAISNDPDVLVASMNTTAAILNGTATGQANVSMQWRARTASEANPANPNAVLSNVLNLTGIFDTGTPGDGILDQFVLQMSYTDTALAALNLVENSIAVSGELRLGWNDSGTWKTAALGNNNGTGTGTFVGAVAYDPMNPLHNVLGAYGVDQGNNVVWAVLNHNSEFAVIPEPSTLVLGGLALLGFAGAGLRKRRLAKQRQDA